MSLNPDWSLPSSGAHNQTTSADNTTVKTVTLASGTKAIYIQVDGGGSDVYMTFDGSTPSSSNGVRIIKAGLPLYISVGSPTIKWIGQAVASNVVNVLCLT